MENFSPRETYRVVIAGDDLSHLIQLIADDRGLEDGCLPCARIEKAIRLAEFHEIVDPEHAA